MTAFKDPISIPHKLLGAISGISALLGEEFHTYHPAQGAHADSLVVWGGPNESEIMLRWIEDDFWVEISDGSDPKSIYTVRGYCHYHRIRVVA